MIVGIQLEMTTDQLREHLLQRSGYHTQRCEEFREAYRQETSQQIADEEALDPDEGFTTISNYGGAGLSKLQRAKLHRAKAAFFKFVAEYLVAQETYRPSEADLAKLELAAAL